jgi:hypothetical protein
MKYNIYIQKYLMRLPNSLPMVMLKCAGGEASLAIVKKFVAHMSKSITENRFKEWFCKVAREVVGGPRGPIVIIVEVIQCKVD